MSLLLHICMTTKACSSTARVNSGSEEMPNSSSLVRFLSELFPVARAPQSAARSASMNHLDIDSYTDAFIQKKIKCVQQRKEVIVHKCRDYEGPAVRRSKVGVIVVRKYMYRVLLYVINDGVIHEWQRRGEGGKIGCKFKIILQVAVLDFVFYFGILFVLSTFGASCHFICHSVSYCLLDLSCFCFQISAVEWKPCISMSTCQELRKKRLIYSTHFGLLNLKTDLQNKNYNR